MKLRIAKKIYNAVGGPRGDCYSQDQKCLALDRIERLASSKAVDKWWCDLMDSFGPEGRAMCLAKSMPASALRILCEQVEGIFK